MRLLIDADGCPVVKQSVKIANEYGIDVIIVKNHAHVIDYPGVTVVTVDLSRDSADYYIVNHAEKGDLIISQDYGLAAMALSKEASILTQFGMEINAFNIDQLLSRRHFNQEMRRKHQTFTHGKSSKRSKKDNDRFESALREVLNKLTRI
jgi:hypothetical protein